MRLRRSFVLASLAAAAAFAACTLNPQPLPPSDGEATNARSPDGSTADAGSFQEPETPPDGADAGVGAVDGDAGDGGDADASDASDADAD